MQRSRQKKSFEYHILDQSARIYHYMYLTFHVDYVWIDLLIQIITCDNDNHHSERNHTDRISNHILLVNIDQIKISLFDAS